jgi:nucleoid-associated protein YgaU
MKTTTFVLIIAFSLALFSAAPLDRRDDSVVLDTSAPLERRVNCNGQSNSPTCRCRSVGLHDDCTEAELAALSAACFAAELEESCTVSEENAARIAAELEEAARIAAEEEAARIAAELKAARIAAEEEAAAAAEHEAACLASGLPITCSTADILISEEEARRVAELKAECLIGKEACSDVELEAWKIECAAVDIAPTCQSVYGTGTPPETGDMKHAHLGLASDETYMITADTPIDR